MENQKKLNGLSVVFFESRHSKTLADLISLQGGRPIAAPAMKEVPLENNIEALRFGEELFKDKIDLLILLTGVGTKALATVLEARYTKEEILAVLKRTPIVPRGPKPVRVLKEWGVSFLWTVPEPNTWRELLQSFDDRAKEMPLTGKKVALQEYGVSNPELIEGLEKRGAKVIRVPVYRWALPDDTGPLQEAILQMVSGLAKIAMFTTAVQGEHLFQVAKKMKLEGPLKLAMEKMVIASVGPDCTEALRSHGLRVDIQPESPKMGPLVLETAEKAAQILAKLS